MLSRKMCLKALWRQGKQIITIFPILKKYIDFIAKNISQGEYTRSRKEQVWPSGTKAHTARIFYEKKCEKNEIR